MPHTSINCMGIILLKQAEKFGSCPMFYINGYHNLKQSFRELFFLSFFPLWPALTFQIASNLHLQNRKLPEEAPSNSFSYRAVLAKCTLLIKFIVYICIFQISSLGFI